LRFTTRQGVTGSMPKTFINPRNRKRPSHTVVEVVVAQHSVVQ
jgi:hypothetical protein